MSIRKSDFLTGILYRGCDVEYCHIFVREQKKDTSSQQVSKSEEELRAIMTDEQRKALEHHMDSVQRFMAVTECLLFQNSFKLGARMMLEVMEE